MSNPLLIIDGHPVFLNSWKSGSRGKEGAIDVERRVRCERICYADLHTGKGVRVMLLLLLLLLLAMPLLSLLLRLLLIPALRLLTSINRITA